MSLVIPYLSAKPTALPGTLPKLYLPFNSTAHDPLNSRTGTLGSAAAIVTTQQKFGRGSLELTPGTEPNNYASVPDSADFTIGANVDFTIECWVRFKSTGSGGLTQHTLISHYNPTGDQRSWALQYRLADGLRFVCLSLTGGTTHIDCINAWSPSNHTWYHLAVTRDGATGVVRAFIDGVLKANTVTYTGALPNSTAALMCGRLQGSSQMLDGFLDEVMLWVGTCRWTATFTPATQPFV